ncbi:MAG: HDOD domain-containing protein [Gammaproteobacteria bacterium]|nr:HDOD domain-containing protein [Gammaproteobacteria bacterium]
MNDALAKWARKLQQQPLPALTANYELLQQLSGSEHADMGRLATIIESDPGLSVMLLRHINQLRHKHLRSEITTPRHALMMLGLQQLRLLLPQISLAEALPRESQLRLRGQFSQAFHAAYQARDWGRLRRDLNVDELYTAALLSNLGEMLLNLYAATEVEKVYALMQQKEMEPQEAQYVVFGFSFAQLTLELARAWHLPNLLCDSMQAENASHNRVLSVMLATQLARCARQGWYSKTLNRLIDDIAELMLSDPGATATLLHRNAVEAAHESALYGVAHPAALLLLPATPPEELPTVAEQSSNVAPTATEESDFCLTPQRRVLAQVLRTLNNPDRTLPLKEVLRLTLEGMHDGLGLNRTVFAGLTPNRDQLRAGYMLGGDNDPGFKRFAIDLNGHNLFVRLLEKPQSLWLDDNNRKKLFPLIPINFHKLINNDSFFVMSLFVRNRPVGLFYADRHSRNCRLDEESYKRFKQLVTMASHHLAARQSS